MVPGSISHAGLLVILPTFNEERSVGRVVEEVRAALPGADVLVVDDGSTDRSAGVARAHGAAVLSLPYNLGVGGAMRAGYKYALRAGYTSALQVDADGQHDPAEAPAVLAALAQADVVIGARFAGSAHYAVPRGRRLAMRFLAGVVSRITHTAMTDVTSGFRACNRRAMQLFAVHFPVEYLGDTVESLIIAARAGLRVAQVPVTMRQRTEGLPSQTPLRAALYLLRAGLAVALTLIRDRPVLPSEELPLAQPPLPQSV